jgi:hypothetical protein
VKQPLSFLLILLSTVVALSGCDLFGDSSEKLAAAREAEGKAVGGACRHAGRAIEDCYSLNKKADKAAVFAGWRDMNDYMRENKIDSVAPQISASKSTDKTATEVKAEAKTAEGTAETNSGEKRPVKAGKTGASAKGNES